MFLGYILYTVFMARNLTPRKCDNCGKRILGLARYCNEKCKAHDEWTTKAFLISIPIIAIILFLYWMLYR